LREAIAAYLGTARGFTADPATIVITQGVRQALSLLTSLVLAPSNAAFVEDPGFWGTRDTLAASGIRAVPVPVDAEGLPLATARALAPEAKLAIVTPAHHYPLGMVMSLQRRLAWLRWASETGGWILEDDYDGEYRYAGRPLTPLRALDRNGRVAYAGSFSKILFPTLRLSYLVLPQALVEAAERAMAAGIALPALTGQPSLARFILEGHFAAHLRRTRRLYAARQQAMVEAADQHLRGKLTLAPDEAGMHLAARLTDPRHDEAAVIQQAANAGIALASLSRHYADPASAPKGFLLGYAAVPEALIRTEMQRLGVILERQGRIAASCQTG
jgi:GntR family transcriptional regulator/MocR family aminotransferase